MLSADIALAIVSRAAVRARNQPPDTQGGWPLPAGTM